MRNVLQERLRQHWMAEGSPLWIRPVAPQWGCRFGRDVVIEPQTHLRGTCQIGDNSRFGPGSLIEDAELAGRPVVTSVVRQAKVGDGVSVSLYAHLAPLQ